MMIAATIIVGGGLALYVAQRGQNNEPEAIYDWQVSAFNSLTGADQAIYNSLYTVKDEIPYIYDDINYFNGPDEKFRWPNLQDFQDYLLPPFFQDTSWEQTGSLQWSLYEPLPEGEMQGSTMYLRNGRPAPEPGILPARYPPRSCRLHQHELDACLVEPRQSRRDARKRLSRLLDSSRLARSRRV